MKLSPAATVAAAVCLLVLTGCAGGPAAEPTATPSPSATSSASATLPATSTAAPSPSATAAPSVTPEPSDTAAPAVEPPTLDELKLSIEGAGFACDTLTINDPGAGILGATESGSCAPSGFTLANFPTADGPQAVLDLSAQSGEPGTFLVGDRWLVGSDIPDDLRILQESLGGEVLTAQ